MKTDREQIRKIADAISYECQQSKTCDNCFERGRICSDYKTAEKLYRLGYRKASEVINEFVEKVLGKIRYEYENYPNAMTVGTYYQLRKEINELADEMRQEVEK